jgi:histone H3/H4
VSCLKADHVMKEIVHYQKSTAMLIPRTPFARICREILNEHKNGLRVSAAAFAALQQIAEDVLVLYFELCNKAAAHAKRITVMLRDSAFVRSFIGIIDPTNPIGALDRKM